MEVLEELKKKYKLIDGKNQLKGVRFSNLINKTNEIINDANIKKENAKNRRRKCLNL